MVKRGRSRSPSRSRSADRKRSSGDRDRDRHSRDHRPHHQSRRSRSRSAARSDRERHRVAPPPATTATVDDAIDEEEAKRIARIAQLAEERAEQRAAERKRAAAASTTTASTTAGRKLPLALGTNATRDASAATDGASNPPKIVFRSKQQREQEALARLHEKRLEIEQHKRATEDARRAFQQRERDAQRTSRHHNSNNDRTSDASTSSSRFPPPPTSSNRTSNHNDRTRRPTDASTLNDSALPAAAVAVAIDDRALDAIKAQYLGKRNPPKKIVKASEKYAKNYKFDWEPSEDTSRDLNPLYANRLSVNLLYGRGYRAGVDMREQRQHNSFVAELAHKRQLEHRRADEANDALTAVEIATRQRQRDEALETMQSIEAQRFAALAAQEAQTMGTHWSEKSVEEMKERDWRIFREDFDITIQGGKAPHPLRTWEEASHGLPTAVFQAIADLKFERPSPIQMQSIPIGLERRDIIGIAETGSGKTAAFVIPIIAYIYALPTCNVDRTPEQGPLALVMAPTRELALQIEQETIKLCKYTLVGGGASAVNDSGVALHSVTGSASSDNHSVRNNGEPHKIQTLSVVGGQSIEDQAFKLREGVDIVIGTPGRLMDCLENHYLVLNQCNYVVLDEADRMIDMGFEPQVVAVLENMGSLLKSENEEEMEQQLSLVAAGLDSRYRVTTMFSATMPLEVERLAKTFLRHPAIVKIGDDDSSKNKRIEQRVLFVAAAKKKTKLVDVLHSILREQSPPTSRREKAPPDSVKAIVFVNVKKECDVVARMLATAGFRITVLHGGKSQDQREESLKGFRDGYCDVLVATDVAGRGLDIPDVTHVINYNLPAKIQSYSHRIGRTGRAGKQGIAISLLTDDDEEIMFDLKQYLIATDMPVPSELANHPSAKAAVGARDDRGNVIARSKRDTVIFAK